MDGSAAKGSKRWRIPQSELATLAEQRPWSPLDGPLPEYIPEQWDGPHCGLRLIEAFKTLALMPNRRIGASSGYWPEYLYEKFDENAQEQSDPQVKTDRTDERNRALIRPTIEDITHMEQAICWSGQYLRDHWIARVVQCVALARSHDLDLAYVARRLRKCAPRVSARGLSRDNRNGLDTIARGLRCDEVRVF